jgi:E3 ubiquitin-protein ligase HUWE1
MKSPALSQFIKSAASVPLIELPSHLESFPRRWDFPRGDLYHWIAPLNRFDEILERFIALYGLGSGPQTTKFGHTLLFESSQGVESEARLSQPGLHDEGDRKLIESILDFSRVLLEKCGNRSLYNSGERLNFLLNTTSLSLLHSTLRVALCLAQRYHARHRPAHFHPGSLSAHYGLDLDRIQILAAPLAKPQSSSRRSAPSSPVKTSKGKDKHSQLHQSTSPNDLLSLSKSPGLTNGKTARKSSDAGQSGRDGWEEWAKVEVLFQPETSNKTNGDPAVNTEVSDQEYSSTPSPLRRQSTSQASKLNRVSTSDDSVNGTGPSAASLSNTTSSSIQKFEPALSTLLSSPIEHVLDLGLSTVPKSSYYELLHKLRVAYALLGNVQSRRDLLAVRILAVSNLAYVSSDATFQQRFLTPDREEPKRFQFTYQLADLLHLGSREPQEVPLHLQTLAINALQALTKQKTVVPDMNAALNLSANHGILLFVVQKALQDLGHDSGMSDNAEGDEWRESLFSLLHVILLSSTPPTRSGEVFASPQLISSYVIVLTMRTQKAQRIHIEVLHFFDAFFHHIKDGLTVLSNNKAFEAVVDLLNYQTTQALDHVTKGTGFPAGFRTPTIDYHVPYTHQQSIRSILPFLNGVITQQGTQADRILRSLIDSQTLLSAFRLIIENGPLFGAHIWSEVVKVMSTFLNNEPTSYTVISEAGLSRSFLESIVLRPLAGLGTPGLPAVHQDNPPDVPSSAGSDNRMNVDEDLPDGDAKVEDISCIPDKNPQGILPAAEAIANISQAFSAICLTTAGSDFFQSSGVLEKFFEIFQSPAHIKVMKDASFLQILGNSFDELVRHHPTLKPAVMSAVIVMVSRIRYLCKLKAWEIGAGAKLWLGGSGGDLRVAGGSSALVKEVYSSAQDPATAEDEELFLQLPNGKRLLAATKITGSGPEQPVPNETDSEGLTVSDYLTPVTSFLIGLFENPSLCMAFLDVGGADLVLDLATLQSLPHGFCQSTYYGGVSHELAQVIHMMAETKPHLVLPALLDRVLVLSQNLEAFAALQSEDSRCYFDPLVTNSDESLGSSAEKTRANGTACAKDLAILQLLVNILSEVFSSPMYHARNREQPAPFMQVNLADVYVEVCHRLGRLSAACHWEGKALERRVPQPWKDATRPAEPVPGREDEHGESDQPKDLDSLSIAESLLRTYQTHSAAESGESSTNVDLKSDEKTAAFKNLRILRRLLFQLPQSTTQFFNQLGHSLIGRKRLDAYQKQNTFMVGGAIAGALLHQLKPPHIKEAMSDAQEPISRELWSYYFVEVLKSCNNVLFDFNTSPDHAHCLTVVALPFKSQGGIDVLQRIGERFFQDLKCSPVSPTTMEVMSAANSGLKSITSMFEHLTSAKGVVECSQSNALKSSDRSKPHHFNPAQFLLELRLETLPFVRAVWDSSYADQASRAVLEKLIAILRHVLNGDQEHEAYKSSDRVAVITTHTPKKFVHSADKINALKSKGYEEGLAREALFRSNNQFAAAEDYCKAYGRNPKLKRNPIPSAQVDSPMPIASRVSTPEESSTNVNGLSEGTNPASTLTGALGEPGAGPSLLDFLGTFPETERPASEIVSSALAQPSSAQDDANEHGNGSVQENENANLHGEPVSQHTPPSPPMLATATDEEPFSESAMGGKTLATVEAMNSQREQIRADLTERCLNIINSHYDVTWELSELVKSATKRLPEQEAAEFRETACSLLVTSLVSFQSDLEADGLPEATRKKISAYAHFVALLIQDKDIYRECLPHLQESFDSLLRFIQIPSKEPNNEASLPWIGQILLIIERMLSDDAEPPQITWNMPTSLNGALPEEAILTEKTIVTKDEKRSLFESLLDILPRVGKDKSLALSISRVLVILTRERQIAVQLSEKRNLQRLFVMMKQLANLADDRIHSSIMLILRHIVEDDETLRQIMRSEIVANFDTRSSRQIDTTTYVRNLYHLVLRSPEIFVQTTKEKLKLQRFDTSQRPQTLTLKSEEPASGIPEASASHEEPSSAMAATTDLPVQTKENGEIAMVDTTSEDVRGKSAESRIPVVEHPDGVIHFLLSQLLLYRDVEDQDASATSVDRPVASPVDETNEVEMGEVSSASSPQSDARSPEKAEKATFTGQDHPIFVYRCFLLQCLTELLHSYNRTKIEFINFSRKSDPLAITPSKPRSGVLNYLLNSLIPLDAIEIEESIQFKKRSVTSEWAMKVIIALCSKTGEQSLVMGRERYTVFPRVEDNDSEPDLTFVRRFVLEHGLKAFKDANTSSESLQTRYARMLCLASLFHQMLSKPAVSEGAAGSNNSSHKTLAKMMFEKDFISVLTASLADIDLTFPGAKRVVKYILKPLNELTETAVFLSLNSSTQVSSALGQSEQDDISSASSVSEADDLREETPDLFRNSALGLLDPNRQDESSSDSEPEDEDDEMYEGEYADDMEFEEDVAPIGANDGEVVSDEDVEDENGPGPMEGLSGDIPMDIELVMGDPHMDLDTDDGEDEDDQDDGDDDDEDEEDEEDEEDFLVDADDVDGGGELNADEENQSLADGEGEWQSADDDTHDADEEDSQDALEEILDQSSVAGVNATNAAGDLVEQGSLNNLLNILGENANAPRAAEGELLGEDEIEHAMQDMQDEDDEDANEDDMDENEDELTYQTFNEMLNDPDTPWPWEEGAAPPFQRTHHHHPPPHHHHHFRAAPGQYTSFMSRHITGHGLPMPSIHRSHRVAPAARPADDGTNPLLQQPGSSTAPGSHQIPSPMDLVHGFGPGFMGYLPTGPGPGTGSGGMLDAIMEAMQRGEGSVEMVDPSGRVDIRVDTTPGRFNDMLIRPSFPSTLPRNARQDPQRTVNFNPLSTVFRWQEEARLLFGMSYVEKTQRVVNVLLSVLVPPAIEEEKARLKKAEEDHKREEEEKAQREHQERLEREESERKKKEEEEEKEAAARAQAEAEQVAPTAAVPGGQDTVQLPSGDEEPMQDVRTSNDQDENIESAEALGEPPTDAGPSQAPAERVFTTIRGRQLDITNMSIDAEYLDALPEELREEVIMQQYAEQRHQAEEQGQPPTDINREFLEALPDDIREELLQQEATERRRRERDAARRRAAESGGAPRAEEMDADSFMATLDPALRRSILADQSEEVLNALGPEYAAEARGIMSRQLHHFNGRMPVGRDAREDRVGRDPASAQKESRKQVVQMVDRAGVATLMRLMFVQQQGSTRNNLHTILHNVCQHRQTRAEVISLLLSILQDGSADVSAVEKSLAHLSLRAKTSSAQKAPPPLKRTLSTQTTHVSATEMTPLMVVQQCLAALASLTQYDAHVASVFLRELESSANYRSKVNRKGKAKENRASRYAINALIALLDRKLITENSTCMENLSNLLATITQPLTWLLKKDKEKHESLDGEKQDEPATIGSTDAAENRAMEAANDEQTQIPQNEVQPVGTADTLMADTGTASAPTEMSLNATGEEPSGSAAADSGLVQAPKATEEAKTKKPFDPPVIPEQNLRLIVGVLAARECNGKTFRDTLSTINSLSLIPGAKDVFGRELISQAQALSQSILGDLNDLLGKISEASSGTEIQAIATAKFSPASADQAKLLRVLTALDYLFDSKRPESTDEATPQTQDILTSLYESSTFGPLWMKLSECLSAIHRRDGMLSVATILLPLIESLMVVCKNTSLKDAPTLTRVREHSFSPGPESGMESLFFNFTTEHRKILNELVRQNSKLMNGSFSLLAKNPKVLEFDNKRTYFTRQIHSRSREARHPQPPLQLSVRRDQVFLDSFRSLYFKSAGEMKYGKLSIRFHGEEGVDAGGVTREWFQVLARGMFNPNYALFIPVASDRTTFHPNRLSGVNSEHLLFFKFIGRIIGKALYEGRVLDCHFSRAVYKKILGKTVSIKDMETLDLDYYKSLVWMLENDITDIITETFSIESDDFGESQTIDLVPNGRNIPVTEENKQEYVQLVVEYRLTGSVQEQLENFLKGFHDIIPAELVSIFTEQELELLISGLPDINVDDWKANTEYHNYSASSPQIQWFWRAVRSFDKEEQAKLLQFVTGTSKVPLNGFKELEGMNGFSRFNIHKDYGNKDRLPSSHTCFNRKLPGLASKE